MSRKSEEETEMDIVWQTPSNPPQRGDYIFRNGIRYVRPYYFEFICHGKNRWAGKTIVDVFAEEFKGRPYDYYVSAVNSGRIQVDGQRVPVSFIVKSSQRISHFLHRHEPPVMAWEVAILQKEPDVLAVCKPATVPVHPCGQYRKNTVVGILEAEHDLAPLFPIHRLDRLVSGLLILARSASKADFFRQQIEAGEVQKQYIAKVIGEFPEEKKVVNVNVIHNPREGMSTVEVANGDSPKGKASCTIFTRISTNGTHSIVLCEPITGRTHQIRVHLQHTGHPIANDNLYLYEFVRDRSTQGMGADRAAAKLARSRLSNSIEDCKTAFKDESFQLSNSGEDSNAISLDKSNEDDFTIDAVCTNCPNLPPKGYEGYEEGLWLHCYRYTGPGWSYECPYPDWASLD